MLVAHWPLTESSGDALDYAGANDGTVNGATQGATGPLGYGCYSFDGLDDDVDTGITSVTLPLTLSLWAYPDQSSNGPRAFGNYNGTSADFYLWDDTYNSNGWVSVLDPATTIKVSGSVDDTQWQHMVVTCDSNDHRLYKNGREIASASGGIGSLDSGRTYKIGNRGDGGPNSHWGGKIADVRLYDHALTPAEVAALADVGSQAAYVSPKQQL